MFGDEEDDDDDDDAEAGGGGGAGEAGVGGAHVGAPVHQVIDLTGA